MHGIVLQFGFHLFALADVPIGKNVPGLLSSHQQRRSMHGYVHKLAVLVHAHRFQGRVPIVLDGLFEHAVFIKPGFGHDEFAQVAAAHFVGGIAKQSREGGIGIEHARSANQGHRFGDAWPAHLPSAAAEGCGPGRRSAPRSPHRATRCSRWSRCLQWEGACRPGWLAWHGKGCWCGCRSTRSAARRCRERGPRALLPQVAKPTFLPAIPAGDGLRHWRTRCAPPAPGRLARAVRQGCPAAGENPSSGARSRSFRSLRPLRLPNLCASSVQEACSPKPDPSMRFVNYQLISRLSKQSSCILAACGNDRYPQKRVAART